MTDTPRVEFAPRAAGVTDAVNEPQLFDIDQAVQYFHELGATGVTRNFVRELIASGGIPRLKLSRKFYITRAAIHEYLVKHERRTSS